MSREEVDAVKNLASLGFSEDDALEAYLSCDKNEAMAASLLFESYTPVAQQRPPPS
jgi:UV excision repair protein RAD23